MNNLPQETNLNIAAFEQMLNLKNITNSYKLYWFTAIFEKIVLEEKEIKFRDIVIGMVVHSWYSILAYKLNLGVKDQLNILVNDIKNKYSLSNEKSKDDLYKYLVNKDLEEIEIKIRDFYKYVPYRLLSPFYEKFTRGEKDHSKNKIIEEKSRNDNSSLYKIFTDKQRIIIHTDWFKYIFVNQAIVKGWLRNKLVYFLQSRNPNVPAIPFKLYPPVKREMTNSKKFWKQISTVIPISDIYTGQRLNSNDISIDHYIPWSFVLHDRLWNLVPTTRAINSSKNDRLPIIDYNLDSFCKLHYNAYSTAIKHNWDKKLLEDYLDLFQINELGIINETIFTKSIKDTILPLHQLAKNSGFVMWNSSYPESNSGYSMVADEDD